MIRWWGEKVEITNKFLININENVIETENENNKHKNLVSIVDLSILNNYQSEEKIEILFGFRSKSHGCVLKQGNKWKASSLNRKSAVLSIAFDFSSQKNHNIEGKL